MSWIDVVGHLAAEALRALWHSLAHHADEEMRSAARRIAMKHSAAFIAHALDKLPAHVVGFELESAALQMVDATGIALGLTHDDRAELLDAVLGDLIIIETRRVAALAAKTAHAFDGLNQNKAIP